MLKYFSNLCLCHIYYFPIENKSSVQTQYERAFSKGVDTGDIKN